MVFQWNAAAAVTSIVLNWIVQFRFLKIRSDIIYIIVDGSTRT